MMDPRKAANQDPENDEKLVRNRRKVVIGLVVVLVLAAIGGFFLRINAPVDEESLNQVLTSELRKQPGGHLTVDFPGTRSFPAGPGLAEWLVDFPNADHVKSIDVSFQAEYVFDSNGDWDIHEKPEGGFLFIIPVPDSHGIRLSADSIKVHAEPALSDEDTKLLEGIVSENVVNLLQEEESGRRKERLGACEERAKQFLVDALTRRHREVPSAIEVRFSGEGTAEEPEETE